MCVHAGVPRMYVAKCAMGVFGACTYVYSMCVHVHVGRYVCVCVCTLATHAVDVRFIYFSIPTMQLCLPSSPVHWEQSLHMHYTHRVRLASQSMPAFT